MRYSSPQGIKENFKNWLINNHNLDNVKHCTLSTAYEYINRINRVCDRIYGEHYDQNWEKLAEDIYPVLLSHILCTKKWHDRQNINVNNLCALILDNEVVKFSDEFHHADEKIKFEQTLNDLWPEPKDKTNKNKVALINLCDFLYKTDYKNNKSIYRDIIKKLDYIKHIKTSLLLFDFIEATKNTPKIILSKNGSKTISSADLVYFLKCGRTTIGKLNRDELIKYASSNDFRYSIQEINTYLKQTHASCKNDRKNKKYLNTMQEEQKNIEKDLACYIKKFINISTTENNTHLFGEIMTKLTEHADILKDINKKTEKWCNLEEASKILGCTKKVIQGLRDRGKICYTQYSPKTIKYLISDLEKIKAERDNKLKK